MNDDCYRRDSCRLCDSQDLTQVLSLAPTPPANAFVAESGLNEEQRTFPLDVFFCEDCAHVQLLDIVDPALLFRDYVYVSGTSPIFVRHFESYAADLLARFKPDPGTLVVDIGSNDGTLLDFFQQAGLRVLGIDPARDIARAATERGIETWDEFFTDGLAAKVRHEKGAATIITANNVFAHADGLTAIVEGIHDLLAPDGVFVFEVSYLVDVFEKTLFDTIYHEHLAYHSVKPLVRFFADNGMRLIEAGRVDSHGGSLRGVAVRSDSSHETGPSVGDCVALEEALKLDRAQTLQDFAARIDVLKAELGTLLAGLKADGKSIAAFGAPAKATTLMYHFGLGPETIDFIVDDSPMKQGLYSPGQHIPVVSSEAIGEKQPDYLLILAWNFAKPIMEKHSAFTESGGHFIVPLPTVEVF